MENPLLPSEVIEASAAFPGQVAACTDLDALLRLKGAFVGREGSHAARLMELLKTAPKEQKRDLGAAINALKNQWEEALKSRQGELEEARKRRTSLASAWDPDLPPPLPAHGALHPLNRLMNRLVEVFRPLGYHVEEGPEVETEGNNFDGLNIPEDHPARSSSDTFYFAQHPELLLRCHTSPVQVRGLKRLAPQIEAKGGIRFLAPGRVYRKDEVDPTHSPMFHQVEGLLVGRGIGMHHLKGTLAYAMKALFGEGADVRFRPSYFPFVEPGCEVDVRCPLCGGGGCRVCKGSGWVELLGAGLVHPNVLAYAGIDPSVWSGFAFGMGVERIAMMVSQTPDLRLFFENDQRFLNEMGGLY
ncbi:MAG TPA: phenylalanine--tRNA ligase subunit alpha [Holophaga sp.]|mgnify:CR=1 FL=1|jgi:phenylalanyl-tRNA synthetase alpha chain|nr:phenylalanine--tRNA ligase subunit alpha [Holophaga sp.]